MTKNAKQRSQELESELMMNDPHYRDKFTADVSGWMPIESVPIDGRPVLLYLQEPFSRVVIARWFDLWENWIEGEFPDAHDEFCGIGSRVPTYWQPIPPAPAKDTK